MYLFALRSERIRCRHLAHELDQFIALLLDTCVCALTGGGPDRCASPRDRVVPQDNSRYVEDVTCYQQEVVNRMYTGCRRLGGESSAHPLSKRIIHSNFASCF